MKKKYFIKDEDGVKYEVEEMEETHDEEPLPEEVHDEGELSADELAALKSLAAVADKLVALVQETHDECKDEDEEDLDDEDECAELVDEDEEEKIIDTDEEEEEDDKKKAKDSKSSVGSLEKKSVKTNDAYDDAQLEIAEAWNARYNGGRK